MKLEDMEIYQMAMRIADEIWDIVTEWDSFAKYTVGSQVVDSSDSIGSNISECYGRYHYKDKLRFMYFSRGSLSETKTWIVKARRRRLIPENDARRILSELEVLGVKENNYIKSLRGQTVK